MRYASALGVGLLLAGCGHPVDPGQRADAERAVQAATEATAKRDYAAAERAWTQAIELGTLDPDRYVDARLQRAVCLARNGKDKEALAELDAVKAGVVNMEDYHLTRSYILKKQGNSRLSSAELDKARQLNPQALPIKD